MAKRVVKKATKKTAKKAVKKVAKKAAKPKEDEINVDPKTAFTITMLEMERRIAIADAESARIKAEKASHAYNMAYQEAKEMSMQMKLQEQARKETEKEMKNGKPK
jgi:hypothetical protein